MNDIYEREIDYLRISITDRCNLRCIYCMPECGVKSLKHDEILTFEEITRVCKIAASLGIKKIKITGGEPLTRKDVVNLIKSVKLVEGIEQITMTTNGVLLEKYIDQLASSGLSSVNISLDSLKRSRFSDITRFDCLEQVKRGIDRAISTNLKVKINCIPIEEVNGDEIADITQMAKDNPIDVRFIELMPIGYGKNYTAISKVNIIKEIEKSFGELKSSCAAAGNGPAVYYELEGFKGRIGFISALTNKFCSSCNRIRLTADGKLKLCLHYNSGIDIRKMLRDNSDDLQLKNKIQMAIYNKPLHHKFDKNVVDNMELRNMVQIGG